MFSLTSILNLGGSIYKVTVMCIEEEVLAYTSTDFLSVFFQRRNEN